MHHDDDLHDLDRDLELDLDALPELDPPEEALADDAPPAPPEAPSGGRPRSDRDHWLSRSPFWVIPLVVSVIFGLERVAMLATVPGWREVPVILFGGLFVLTFALVLALGGLVIHRHRY